MKESDACFDWFANHLDPVYDNTDEFVRLYLEDGNYQWCARDAVHKVGTILECKKRQEIATIGYTYRVGTYVAVRVLSTF